MDWVRPGQEPVKTVHSAAVRVAQTDRADRAPHQNQSQPGCMPAALCQRKAVVAGSMGGGQRRRRPRGTGVKDER